MSTRLGYLLKKFPRLSETFVLNEILAQEDLGRSIHVFSRRAPDEEPRHPQLERLRATTEVLPAKHALDPFKMLFEEAANSVETFARVGELVRSASWCHPRFAALLAEAIYLLRRTRELGIGHVHTHFATDSAVVAMMLNEIGGPSYSITAHAKDIFRATVDPQLLERMFVGSEFVVTVCDANVRFLEERLGDPAHAKIRRLYNGVDLDAFSTNGHEREPNHVLAVGRLVEKKGFHVLLDALHRLGGRRVPFVATIIGDGDQRVRLEQQVRALGLDDRVSLTGPLDQSAVRERMQRATVLCQPCVTGSDGNRDALPTVLLEALACGLPAISTPVTGIPEILDEGSAGVLVPENDAEATARELESLLKDAKRRAVLAERGRRHAEALFDIEKNSRVLASWFDAVLAEEDEACASPA